MPRLAPLALTLCLAACAASAPSLPPDTTALNRTGEVKAADFQAADLALTCDAIAAERQTVATSLTQANAKIEANAGRNQTAMYAGAVLLGPIGQAIAGASVDKNEGEKAQITQLYGRRDVLIKLAAFKGCGVGG